MLCVQRFLVLQYCFIYIGVAYHGLHALQEAEAAFAEAVKFYPDEAR